MEIGSLGGVPPQNPGRKSGSAGAPNKKEANVAQDSFSGPSTGELLKKIESMDGTREEKIQEIKKSLSEGAYLTEERIQGLVDKLISNL